MQQKEGLLENFNLNVMHAGKLIHAHKLTEISSLRDQLDIWSSHYSVTSELMCSERQN